MASSSSLPDEDYSCPVCCNIFTDPVLLACGHSLCKACQEQWWKSNEFNKCPICRKLMSSDKPSINFALKNLCETFKIQRERKHLRAESEVLCSLHKEKYKLFCLEDEEPICLVCQASKKHKSHDCIPVDEAIQEHKEEIQTSLKPLKEKLKVFNEAEQTCDQTAEHIKDQGQYTESLIMVEFEKLHQFLREEEKARIAALMEEEEQKSQMMKKNIEEMKPNILSLSNTITDIEANLKDEDILFLQNFRSMKERTQVTLPDPQPVSGALVDVAKHLGNLQFRVWEKMCGIVKHTPVNLDPNTAHPRLSLSDDLTSVRNKGRQLLPDNPERFMKNADVLASEGFSSGQHSWEVEVGDHRRWNLGVAEESTDRKGERFATSKYGIWGIILTDGKYTNGLGETLTLKSRPQKIRVQLDLDKGKVSFYDSNNMILIFTHQDTFTEKLYPYFSIGKAGEAKHPDIKICQSKVSLTLTSQ
ncbi:hypothetical protein UPYG_G00091790 [Umbra pygmaea]|uniref:Zinc-binding protein A33-like n=1 Tax=Umbra pygmaea TaxID=75934 RepID=A0ABD0XJ97_UMBPY